MKNDALTPPLKSRVSLAFGILSSLLGAVVLGSWHAQFTALIKIPPTFVAIKYNTALGILILGLGLAMASLSYVGRARALGGIVAVLGLLSQLQNILGIDFGIDQLFMRDYLDNVSLSPGRMSPLTAVCFLISGFALYLTVLEKAERWFMPAATLSAGSLALCITSVLGYIADIEAAYRWEQYVGMAVSTATGFTFLNLGILFLIHARQKTEDFHGGLPFVTIIFFSVIALRLHQAQGVMMETTFLQPDTTFYLIFLMGLVIALVIDFLQRERSQVSEILKLSHAVEQSPVTVVITNHEGNIEYVNKKFCQLTGYDKDEVLGKNPRILQSGEQTREFYRELWENLLSGREWHGQFHNRKKNGELYWENALIFPIENASKEMTHFVAIKEDITEKKRLSEELSENEEKYRQFFETCPDATILFDYETLRIVDVNEASLKLYQYNREEFLKLSVTELSDEPACCVHHLEATQSGKISLVPHHFHKKKDGSLFPMEAVQGSFTAKGRKIIFCIGHDISRQLEEGKKLRSAEKAVQLSDKLALLGTLTASVCHEALNPLNIISMQVQMMLKREKENPALMERLLKIMEEVKRIVKIMGTFMVFSRKPGADSKTIQMNTELDSIVSLFEKDLLQNNIKIFKDYQDALPDITIEPDEMRQVFLNLINNAKYAMKQGGKLTLTTRHVKTGDQDCLRIGISDTGCGIKKEHLPQIFEPFFTTKPEGEGTGIGLSMVYSLIEKHCGTIKVESEEGKGTSFTVELPIKKTDRCDLKLETIVYPEKKNLYVARDT